MDTITPPDDRELITRCQAGSRGAFEQLVLKYQDRIYNLCRHMIADADEAQDAAQDVFVKVYVSLKGYRPDAAFYTLLYRIAINTCLDHKKRSRPELLQDDVAMDSVPSDRPSPERLYQAKETGRLIEAALQKLSKRLRAVIVLKEIEGLSYQEIADTLHTSVGTVKSRISRARDELRRLLEKKV
jgi:RNA polymerase sigma-70 factor, ECF subfamily